MNTERPDLSNWPEGLRQKLAILQNEIGQIITAATRKITTELPGPIQFTIENSAPQDILTAYERAQAISFVTRYADLPSDPTVQIREHDNAFHISNIPFLRHTLNDFRSIIMNQKDSIYYQKIHKTYYTMLARVDSSKGTTIRAADQSRNDVTKIVRDWLSQHTQAITFIMRAMEFDYLYNGVLQHSGEEYSTRFLADYMSGEMNYILWKHAHILGFIRHLLFPYYQLTSFFTSPPQGTSFSSTNFIEKRHPYPLIPSSAFPSRSTPRSHSSLEQE